MEDVQDLQQKIQKLESDHKAYVQFGAGCFIGIFATGMMLDQTHDPILWLCLVLLIGSLIGAIVIAVRKDLEKDRYVSELQSLKTSNSSNS